MAKLTFGGTGNIQGLDKLKLNANPHTGTPMAKFGGTGAGAVAVPMGQAPKRSRGGSVDPLAAIPKDMLTAFNALKNPKLGFRHVQTEEILGPVDSEGEEVTAKVANGELVFTAKDGTELEDVLFINEAGEQYTSNFVEPVEILDRIPVEGSPATINKVYNAMQKFNKATGKELRLLFERNVMDDSGTQIVSMVKILWRVR